MTITTLQSSTQPATDLSLVPVATPLPLAPKSPVRDLAERAKGKVVEQLRRPAVVATATLAATVITEIGLHALAHTKPGQLVRRSLSPATSAISSTGDTTTTVVTEIVTMARQVHTVRHD